MRQFDLEENYYGYRTPFFHPILIWLSKLSFVKTKYIYLFPYIQIYTNFNQYLEFRKYTHTYLHIVDCKHNNSNSLSFTQLKSTLLNILYNCWLN